MSAPTAVIGLDGSNWPLINSYVDEGFLPNFAELRAEGAHANSRACLPPVTCPNWKCYASGKNPGQLGVYWWERIDTIDRSMHLPDSTDFTSPELWDYLNEAGLRTAVVNLPMSYPPREIKGIMVAGGPRSRERKYTTPTDLQGDLEDRFDYRVHPQHVLTSNEDADAEVEMIYNLIRARLRTAKALLEEYDLDFLHVTLFHLNVLHHYFYDGPETRRAYEIVDEEIDPFVQGNYNLVLMSDHGCTEIDTVFYVNRWLEEEGYLATKTSLASQLHAIGLTQERIASIFRFVGIEPYIRPIVPRQLIERFPSQEGVVREEKLNMIEWEKTTAVGSGQGLIYAVAGDEAEREKTLSNLARDLANTVGPNGKPIAREVHRREELYHGDKVHLAPDLIFDQRHGVHTSEAMGTDEVFSEPTNWRAENVPEGMVLFHGEDVQAQEIEPISITDIAPTILHWMGQPVPTDLDGEVITEVFALGSEPATREVAYRDPLPDLDSDPSELDEAVEDRLQQIGYLE